MQPGITDAFVPPAGRTGVAEFQADFPIDGVEDDSRILQWPGHSIAGAIVHMIRDLGLRVTEPRDEQEHGWTFNVTGRLRSWFQVTYMSDYVILTYQDMGSGAALHAELLTKLNAKLEADDRFHNIRWFTDKEYDQRPVERMPVVYGAPRPPPELEPYNVRFGPLRVLLFIVLRFLGLPAGILQALFAVGAFNDHNPSAIAHTEASVVLVLAGTFGASWLVKGLRW